MDLFNNNGAMFSPCRKYRYALLRMWNLKDPLVMFIGLNPSTANESTDDPTIRRVCKFAFNWGFGGVYMMNLFPRVSSDPVALLDFYNTPFHDIELEENDKWLKRAAEKCDDVVFAWGAFPEAAKRSKDVIEMFPGAKALVINKDGSPRHPLYVKGDVELIDYKAMATLQHAANGKMIMSKPFLNETD